MNKQIPLITSVLLVLGSSVAVVAAPISVDATGLLASPAAQPPVQDPTIQKAIEWIQNKQIKPVDLKKSNPEKTIGQKPETQHRLILGGPETIPM